MSKLICLTLIATLFLTLNALAQSTALLTGTVVDPTGAVIPGAQVACRNVNTDLKSSATTNSAGLFRFPNLLMGQPIPARKTADGWEVALGEPVTTWYEITVKHL